MTTPFLLFALPRSRTFWTSTLLCCNHDSLVECDSLDDFAELLTVHGTVETGAVQGWHAIRAKCPEVRFGILHRPVEQILSSLRRLGTTFDELELRRQYGLLGNLASTGVPVWQAEALSIPAHAKSLSDWALGGWNGERYNQLVNTNLQIDWWARMARLEEKKEVIARLKAEALSMELALPVEIKEEGWATVAAEVAILGKSHFDEVNAELPGRKFCPDNALLQSLSNSGALRGMAARRGGHLVGYSAWNIFPDAECIGQTEARQGPWYCTPQAGHGTARKLLLASIEMLTKLGIDVCYLHHHFSGRGARLGSFYKSLGAVPAMNTYQLQLKGRKNG